MQLAGAPGAGGNVYNTGLISGSYRGVIISGGTIFGAGYGIRFSYGSGNTVVNAGTIDNGVSFLGYGNRLVVYPGAVFTGAVNGGASLSSQSTIELASAVTTGTLSGLGIQFINFTQLQVDPGASWYFDPSLAFAGTLTNAGTIGGSIGSAPGVIQLAPGYNNRLVMLPGADFVSAANGGNALGATAISTLELASGASDGTLTGLGSHYYDFADITVDAGASWTLLSDAIGSGYSIYDGGTLTNTGSLGSTVTLSNGVLVNAAGATLSSNHAGVSGSSGTVKNAGGISAGIGFFGVTLSAGGLVSNASSGLIEGLRAVQMSGSGTVLNAGSLIGVNSNAIQLDAGGIVVNAAGATIVGYQGVGMNGVGTVVNYGGITGNGPVGFGVILVASGDGTELTALCFCVGTKILTPSGERHVQDLVVGDLVTTASGETRPISWLGAGKVLATRGRRNAATPVIVRKNAIAPNVPNRDLRVTKGHCLYRGGRKACGSHRVRRRRISSGSRATRASSVWRYGGSC